MSLRPGFSLLEAMSAVLAGGIACAAMAALIQADDRLAVARDRRLARLETIRITAGVLRRELMVTDPAVDLGGAGGDSVALRLFRGMAVVCGSQPGGGAAVVYAGEREPDTARDSVLPLAPAGAAPLRLRAVARAPGACPLAPVGSVPGEPAARATYTFDLGAELAVGTPLLLFQRGVYALSGSALRVRHGAEGRQPLTGEWLSDHGSRLVLRTESDSARARVEVTLTFTTSAPAVRLRFPLPNAVPLAAGGSRP